MYQSASSGLFAACRVLFGPEVNLTEEFLDYLQPGGVKSAYRRKAKETHPDTFCSLSSPAGIDRTDSFRKLAEAYQLLSVYIDTRENKTVKAARRSGRQRDEEVTADHGTETDRLYYRGELPSKRLQLGRFLYYRGVISFQTLINALTWQRKCFRPLGRLAHEAGWLSVADIATIVGAKKPGKFGEKAVGLGLLNPIQLSVLLLRQRSDRRRIGDYFVDHGRVSRKDIERLVAEMQRHNSRFTTDW